MTEIESKIESYFEWMRVKNYSEETIEGRGYILRFFRLWCENHGITSPVEVTRQVLESYQRYLYHYRDKRGKRLMVQSRETKLTALRSFFGWLSKYKHILYNPASDLEMPRREHRLPRVILTQSEVEQVMNQVDLSDPMGLRDRAILELLYSTGIRRSELCRLEVKDLDIERGLLMIRQGKNKKDRLIPVGERALKWLEKYLYELRPDLTIDIDEERLFLTRRGDPIRSPHLTRIVSTRVSSANIGKEGSCHIFRHTMATLMLEGGADIRFIQQMLGHVQLETTQIYTQVAINKLQEVHNKTHPAAQLKPKKKIADLED